MPRLVRVVLGVVLLVGTIGLVTCQNVFIDGTAIEHQTTQGIQ